MAFDPAAATAAYLAAVPPEAQAKAVAYTQGGHWILLWTALIGIVAAVIVLKLGVLRKTQAKLERNKPRPLLTAFVLSLIFIALSALITLPWDIYADWAREKSYGLTSQPLAGWLVERLIMFAISLVLTALFLTAVYWLIRRAPRLWPVWAGVLTAAVTLFLLFLSPIFIEPIFNRYREAPAGPVREMVVQMGKQVGVPTDKIYIYDGSKQSNRYTANVSGLFGTARVAMSDVMFKKGADLAEVRGVVGHEMGHYKRGHIPALVAVFGVLAAIGGFLTQWLFPWVQRLVREESIAGIADPAGLPILVIIVTVLGLLATPVNNSIIRLIEADADNFSLVNFNEPDGLAKALVKTGEYRAPNPGALEEVIFYDHPSVGWRVRNAMNWKAAHMGDGAKAAPAPAPAPNPPAASGG